jgi:hypothetical protein
MTPDAIKFSPEYKEDKRKYSESHEKLRKINQLISKNFKNEEAQERAAKRKILQEHQLPHWKEK